MLLLVLRVEVTASVRMRPRARLRVVRRTEGIAKALVGRAVLAPVARRRHKREATDSRLWALECKGDISITSDRRWPLSRLQSQPTTW